MIALEQIDSFIKTSPIPTLIIQPEEETFSIAALNTAFLQFTETDHAQVIGKSIFNLFIADSEHRKLLQTVKDMMRHVLFSKAAVKLTFEPFDLIAISTIHHQLTHIHSDIYPILDENQEVKYIVQNFQAVHTSVAKRGDQPSPCASPETKPPLENYYKRMADILESIGDGFFAVDLNWIVTYWNIEAERIFRTPRHKIIGKNIWEIYHRAGPLIKHLKVINDTTSHMEDYFPSLDLWIEASVFPSENGHAVYFQDISDRKKIESELTKEKLKYEDLFNLSPLPQFIYDLDSLHFLDVNLAAISEYGYSKTEFLLKKLSDIRPAEDLFNFHDTIKNQLVRGQFNQSNARHLKKNGQIMHVSAQGNSIAFDDKNARLAIIVDQTDKLQAQKMLEYNVQRFKALVQEGSDLIAIIDADGVYQYVNATSKTILGIESAYYIGKNVFDFIHDDDKEEVASNMELVLVQKRVQMAPFRFKISASEFRWIETVLTNMMTDLNINGIIANSRDVTERITSEIKIQQSMERLDIVSKATSDAIWDWDIITNEVVWNKGIKGIFGYKTNRFNHDWWYEQVHPEDLPEVTKKIEYSIRHKRSVLKAQFRYRTSDGTYKHVLDRSFLLFDHAGRPVRMIGSMQDITEMTKKIEEIKEQNIRLKDISWMQSHMVRSPLARIIGLTELIISGGMDEESLETCLSYLLKSANDLDQIVCEIIKKT